MNGGGGLPVHRHSYGAGIGWNYGGPLTGYKNDKSQFESQAEQKNSSISGLYVVKIRYNSLWTNDWARRVHV